MNPRKFLVFDFSWFHHSFVFLVLEPRISSFYYTKLLQINQGKIREHPGENIIYGNMRIEIFENFEILETLGVHFLNFWNLEFLNFW